MIRIGILGADGGSREGHASSVCKILKKEKNVEITGIYGDNANEVCELAAAENIGYIAKEPGDLLGKTDAVFVMNRNGDRHLACALPFLEKGLPVFVDKPFACKNEDAEKMVRAARKSGSIICGGSYVRYAAKLQEIKAIIQDSSHVLSGYLSFPIKLDSPYGGMHFYSHHIIGSMLEIFGTGVLSVTADCADGKLAVIACYKNFPVVLNFAANYKGIQAGVYLDNGEAIMQSVDINGLDEYQCKLFLNAVKTGTCDESEQMLLSVKISNAIMLSLTGERKIYL